MAHFTRPPLRGDELLLTYQEAADELRVSRQIVQQLADRGEIPTVIVGSRPRIAREDLERFIRDSRTRNGVPA